MAHAYAYHVAVVILLFSSACIKNYYILESALGIKWPH